MVIPYKVFPHNKLTLQFELNKHLHLHLPPTLSIFLTSIYSEMRLISLKTVIYQNDHVNETFILVLNYLDMECCP